MNKGRAVFYIFIASLILIIALCCVAPAIFSQLSSSTDVAESTTEDTLNNYGYLAVQSVTYKLDNLEADITVKYTIEPWISVLVFLFGKQDLKKRIQELLHYPEPGYNQEVTFQYVGINKAVLHVTNVSVENQNDSYWLRKHSFGCHIPLLTFIIPNTDDNKTFENIDKMSKGFAYFRT